MRENHEAEIAELRAQLERLQKLSRVDHLVKTFAEALDVRQVFDRVAEVAKEVLPIDGMLMGQLINDGRNVRTYVTHGLDASLVPEVRNVSHGRLDQVGDYLLIEDVERHPEMAESTVVRFGMRSAVFVAV